MCRSVAGHDVIQAATATAPPRRARRARRSTSCSSTSGSAPARTASRSAAGCAGAGADLHVLVLTARDGEAPRRAGAQGGRRRLRDEARRRRRAAQPGAGRPCAAIRLARPAAAASCSATARSPIDTGRAKAATVDGTAVALTYSEFEILRALLDAEGRPCCPRRELLRAMFGDDGYRDQRAK